MKTALLLTYFGVIPLWGLSVSVKYYKHPDRTFWNAYLIVLSLCALAGLILLTCVLLLI